MPAPGPRGMWAKRHRNTPSWWEPPSSRFLGGILSATVSRSNRRSDWQQQARNWRDRGSEMSDLLQSAAPDVSKVAGDAGKYVSQAMSENSVSGLLIAAAVGGVLGYLLHSRS